MKSKDGRYEVRYWRWHVNNHDMSTDSLEEALYRALALDDEFDEGYHGISFIYDTETKRCARVGNGALRDKEHSTDSLEWKEATQ